MSDPTFETLDEAECLRLISPGGLGRLAYSGRFGLTVMPVNYRLHEGSIVFRTEQDSPTDEDLRTGIAGAEYRVAFEVDDVDTDARAGWSVLMQGDAHHVDSADEAASVRQPGVRVVRRVCPVRCQLFRDTTRWRAASPVGHRGRRPVVEVLYAS